MTQSRHARCAVSRSIIIVDTIARLVRNRVSRRCYSGEGVPMPNQVTRKTYGTVSADRQKEMSGLEFVQGLVDGTLPLNTIPETLGYDGTEAASGRVVGTVEPSGIHLNPAGTVHGGLAATLLDSCMGLAV